MNKTHGSRKRDIEMFIKIELLKGDIKKAIDIAEHHHITPKDFGKLSKEIQQIG